MFIARLLAMPTTLQDISRIAGTSHVTVSMALRDHPRISLRRREQIKQLAREMNYQPNPIGRAMRGDRNHAVGFCSWGGGGPALLPVLNALESCAEQQDYVIYRLSLPGHAKEREAVKDVRRLCDRRIDGLVLHETMVGDDTILRYLAESKIPVVVMCMASPIQAVRHAVWVDLQQAMTEVAHHVAGFGHREAIYFPSNSDLYNPAFKVEPYRRACAHHGIELMVDAAHRLAPELGFAESAYQHTRALIQAGQLPTAMLLNSDEAAAGAMAAIHDAGLSIPGDVSVVGFDDLPTSRFLRPGLTTVRRPGAEVGEKAFQLLKRLMDEPGLTNTLERVPCELVVRQSTGPVPVTRRRGTLRDGSSRGLHPE
jgi:LacI family transcriptional regulator